MQDVVVLNINGCADSPVETLRMRAAVAEIERSEKTYVAALDGAVLGGAFELALACDYRIATPRATFGFPALQRGLIPGAGGTQRLPRLIGAQAALHLILTGETLDALAAQKLGIIDEIADEAVVAAPGKTVPKRRLSAQRAELGIAGAQLFALPFAIAEAHKRVPAEDRGGFAAHKAIDAIAAAVELDFPRGLAREYRLYAELLQKSAPGGADVAARA